MYRATPAGRERFKTWLATPSERAKLRDDLQVKLNLSEPDDLPELLAVAEAQASECMAELATLRRPVLAHVAEPEVPWEHAAVMIVDDLNFRWVQTLVDWLNGMCELIEERIERTSDTAPPHR